MVIRHVFCHANNDYELCKFGRLKLQRTDFKPTLSALQVFAEKKNGNKEQDYKQICHPCKASVEFVIHERKPEHNGNADCKEEQLLFYVVIPIALKGLGIIIACGKQHNNAECADCRNCKKKQVVHAVSARAHCRHGCSGGRTAAAPFGGMNMCCVAFHLNLSYRLFRNGRDRFGQNAAFFGGNSSPMGGNQNRLRVSLLFP